MPFKIGEKYYPKREKIGKDIKEGQCKFDMAEAEFTGVSGIGIKIFDLENNNKNAGYVFLQDFNKDYIQLRFIKVDDEYQGGNTVILLYKESINYAESLSKKLVFDNMLTIAAYKSFKKLEKLGYTIIENPDVKFNGEEYSAPGSWVLRVERQNKNLEK